MLLRLNQIFGIASSLKNLWPLVGSWVIGVIVAWLGWWTNVLQPYGVLGWVGVAILASTLLTLSMFLGAYAWDRMAKANATIKWSKDVSSINPMADAFDTQRIRLTDIVHPITQFIENKRFHKCELIGPGGVVLLNDTTLKDVKFTQCDFVAINSHRPDPVRFNTGIGITNCHFSNCQFQRVTVFLDPSVLAAMRAGGMDVPLLNA